MKSLQFNIWKFYLIAFFGIRFIAPIRILYLISYGLTYQQIGMMELAAAIAIIVLEIPSGIFADIFGRKNSRIIAYIFSTIAFSCLSFGSSSMVFIIGWALSGAADAFESGAQDALIYDTLKALNREAEYIKLKSHFLLINTFSTIIGSIIGAYLYQLNHRIPWYLVTLTIVMSLIVFLFVKEPKIQSSQLDFGKYLNIYGKSFVKALTSINIQRLIFLGMIFTIPMYVFTTLVNQPYLMSRGFSVYQLGVVVALISGLSAIISFLSDKVESRLKKRNSFILLFVSFPSVLILMGLTLTPSLVIILVLVFYVIDNYKNLILDTYINESIESESRATVLSVRSFVSNIGISLLFIFIGVLVDKFGIDKMFVGMGIVLGFVSVSFLTFVFTRKAKLANT